MNSYLSSKEWLGIFTTEDGTTLTGSGNKEDLHRSTEGLSQLYAKELRTDVEWQSGKTLERRFAGCQVPMSVVLM